MMRAFVSGGFHVQVFESGVVSLGAFGSNLRRKRLGRSGRDLCQDLSSAWDEELRSVAQTTGPDRGRGGTVLIVRSPGRVDLEFELPLLGPDMDTLLAGQFGQALLRLDTDLKQQFPRLYCLGRKCELTQFYFLP